MKRAKKNSAVQVMIEIPKGCRNKYEYDAKANCIRFNRTLFSSVHYPSDYGFIIDTLAGDGDALDAMVLLGEATFPGCMIEAKPIGLFKMRDEKGPDEKVLCVPVNDPLWSHISSLKGIAPHLLREIEHFFSVYKDLERKRTTVQGWFDEKVAWQYIASSQKAYQARLAAETQASSIG